MRAYVFALMSATILVSCGFADGDDRLLVEVDRSAKEEFAGAFVTEWQVQAGEELVLPLPEGFSYNFKIDWGDGNEGLVNAYNMSETRHIYEEDGTYVISISGLLEAWSFWRISDSRDNLLAVRNLGDVGWKSLFGAFASCRNLTTVVGGNVAEVTDMGSMFDDTVRALPDGRNWDTANVTDMSYMFAGALLAEPLVSDWDTSAVRDMNRMFAETEVANPDVSSWNTASVMRMAGMFYGAVAAHPDTSNWNTSSVTDMSNMFNNAVLADPDVSCWNTANVTDMSNMFYGASKANPEVSCWDVAQVTNMKNMFRNAVMAAPDMSEWEISAVVTMEGMFRGVSLPSQNWSDLLISAASTSAQKEVVLDGGQSYWNESATEARAELLARGWSLIDLGQDEG